MRVLADTPHDRFHWIYVPPAPGGFAALREKGSLVNRTDYEGLSKMRGLNKSAYKQFDRYLEILSSPFKCERCGKELGLVENWPPTAAFALDSASGLNTACLTNTVGGKPAPHEGEWGTAIGLETDLIDLLTFHLKCTFVLTTHVKPAKVIGELTLQECPAVLGRGFPSQVGKYFEDVVRAEWLASATSADPHRGYRFTNNQPGDYVKAGFLPRGVHAPDLGAIVRSAHRRAALGDGAPKTTPNEVTKNA